MSKDVEVHRRKRGRPAGLEGLDIAKVISDLFLQGCSPGFIIQKTGFDKNTVYEKYNLFLEIAKEQDEKDFRVKYEQKKNQFIMSMEDLIYRTTRVLSYLEVRMEIYMNKEKDIPEHQLQKFSELTKNLMTMQKEKAVKNMKLPLANEIENTISEEVENNDS